MSSRPAVLALAAVFAATTLICARAVHAQKATVVAGQVCADSGLGTNCQSTVPNGGFASSYFLCSTLSPLSGSVLANAQATVGARSDVAASVVGSCSKAPSAQARMVVNYTNDTPIAGVFDLTVVGSTTSIDIGRNGTHEQRNTSATNTVAAVLTTTELQVEMATRSDPKTSFAVGTADFRVGVGALSTTLPACGARLTAWLDAAPSLELRAGHDAGNPSVGFFVFGIQPTALRVPPLGCTYGVLPVVALPATTSAGQASTLSAALAASASGANFYCQFLVFEASAGWRISNRVQVSLP